MKKLLLATSCLVALSTSALAAEFTISGKHEFNYQAWTDDATNAAGHNDTMMTNDTTITIKAKHKLENGLEVGATLLDMEDGVHDTDGISMYINSDMGKIVFGGNSAGDSYSIDGLVAGDSYFGTGDPEYAGGEEIGATNEQNGISYHFGNENISAGIGLIDAGTTSSDDTISYGIKAGLPWATLQAAYETDDLVDKLSIGGSVKLGNSKITVAQNTKKDDAGTYKYTGNSIGVETKITDDLKIDAHLGMAEDSKDTGFDFKQKAVTLTKTLAPGIETHLTWTDYEEKQSSGAANDETGTSYNFGVKVSF